MVDANRSPCLQFTTTGTHHGSHSMAQVRYQEHLRIIITIYIYMYVNRLHRFSFLVWVVLRTAWQPSRGHGGSLRWVAHGRGRRTKKMTIQIEMGNGFLPYLAISLRPGGCSCAWHYSALNCSIRRSEGPRMGTGERKPEPTLAARPCAGPVGLR